MKNMSYWEQFMQSGRVEDYLQFKSVAAPEHTDVMTGKSNTEGEYPHAGFHYGDGDGTKDGAYRGV